ncbi:hypothetical protein MLD38_012591 [Melastoma candidum]|nr:hypothetical protein MLD38_012591 [Melastoma candidum]
MAYHLGSPEVISIQANVSKVEDCQSFVDDVVRHFGRLDHLVANAGIAPVFLFEDCTDVTKLVPAMDKLLGVSLQQLFWDPSTEEKQRKARCHSFFCSMATHPEKERL